MQKGLSGVISLVLNVLHPYECNLVAGGQRLERANVPKKVMHLASLVWTVQDLGSLESKFKVHVRHIPSGRTLGITCVVSVHYIAEFQFFNDSGHGYMGIFSDAATNTSVVVMAW